MPVLASIFRDLYDATSPHDRDVLAVLDSLTIIYEVLECTEYRLPHAEQTRFENAIAEFLLAYRALNHNARNSHQKLWHEVPKFHYKQHLGLTSRYSNTRWSWCYADEDFMELVKAL